MDYNRKIILPSFYFFLFAYAAYQVSFAFADPDLWGHLYNGKVYWVTKAIQQPDTFSFTATGKVWVNHEWLGDLILLFCYSQIGQHALIYLKILVGLTIAFLILKIFKDFLKNPLLIALIFLLVIKNVALSFMIRPQIFTIMFFAVFLYIFYQFRNGHRLQLLLLPFIMLLWTCIHGGFIMGLTLMWIETFLVILSLYREKQIIWRHGEFKWLFGISLTSTLIIFLNPYGIDLVHMVIRAVLNPVTHKYIGEWTPISFSRDFVFFFILLIVALGTISVSRKSKYEDVVRMGVFLAAALLSVRNIPLFCLAACEPVARHLADLADRYNLNRDRTSINSLPKAIIGMSMFFIAGLVFLYFAFGLHKPRPFKIQIPKEYPVGTLNFIKENQLSGNVWIPFNWGEYAIWKLCPLCRVNIDGGRYDLMYTNEQLMDSFTVSDGVDGWLDIIKKYNPDLIVMERKKYVREEFEKDPDWELLYTDPVSFLFVPTGKYAPDTKWIEPPLIYYFP